MSNPYVFQGLGIATLRCHKNELGRVSADLGEKATPDHVSVVAPKYMGKTVLLNAIEAHFSQPEARYKVVINWDLRHETPEKDRDFLNALAKKLDQKLLAVGISKYHEYLIELDEEIGENISTVVSSLGAEGQQVLILLDDLHQLAMQAHITKNLWDYLRGLAQNDHLRFVTSSRKGLRDSIPNRESRTSDFWNIFTNVITLKPIEISEFDVFTQPLRDEKWSFDESAKKEFFNWTGGIPVLASRLCHELFSRNNPAAVNKPLIDLICESIAESDWAQDVLGSLWEDCTQDLQGDLIDLAGNSGHVRDIPVLRLQQLANRGYLIKDGNSFKISCKFMLIYAGQHQVKARDLRDLFKDPESELRSLKTLLELRLAEIVGGDPDTRNYIEHAIEGLSRGTKAALSSIRSIADEAITVAWNAECPNNTIRPEMQQQLTLSWESGGGGIRPEELLKLNDKNVRRKLLRIAVGDQGKKKVTQKVTRPMMLLIDHLCNLGNYGQHINDIPAEVETPVDVSFCASACWASVELLKRMSDDLK